jgi:putative tricarboxylic transport membrane protein
MASDRIFGLVVVMVALGYILSATQIPTTFLADPVGSKTFPFLVGGIMVICGIYVMIKPDADPDWPIIRTFGALAITVIVLVGYAYALKPLGFLIPTALAAGILSYQLSPRPMPAVFTGVGLSAGLFVLFKFALGLGLFAFPKAWLG